MADNVTVSDVAWRDVFPGVLLLRAFRLSISGSILLLAAVATWLTPLGWRLSEQLFVDREALQSDVAYARLVEAAGRWPVEENQGPTGDSPLLDRPLETLHQVAAARARLIYVRFVAPFRELFRRQLPMSKLAYLSLGVLWTLLVWGFFGGTITRLAAVRLGCEQRLSLSAALRYAGRKLPSYFFAPLFPLLAVGLVVLLSIPLGWLMLLDAGVLVAGLVWFLELLGGLMMAILLLGLALGWPLMWPTISSEDSGDVFEATQRCYSYTFERPLNYLLYALLAALLGGLGWILVFSFSEAVIELSFWAVSWGAGHQRVQLIREAAAHSDSGLLLGGGSQLIGFWVQLVRTLAAAYVYSFLWCAATAIYLLLRQDVDQTEFDEIYLEEEQDRFGLPPLQLDEAGVPGVAPETVAPESGDAPQQPSGDDSGDAEASGKPSPDDG